MRMTQGRGAPFTLMWVMTQAALPTAQLLVYEFGPDAKFEGQLGGALERFESAGALRILEAMFIQRDAETDELVVIELRGSGAGGLISPILDFRFDPAARRRATNRALGASSPGIPAETLRELGGALAPGAAMAALLVKHEWAEALEDAVARTGGAPLLTEFVPATTLLELAAELRLAAGRRRVSVRSPRDTTPPVP
jgi:hypothetical protein